MTKTDAPKTEPSAGQHTPEQLARLQREAEALRQNLLRRKQQARARQARRDESAKT